MGTEAQQQAADEATLEERKAAIEAAMPSEGADVDEVTMALAAEIASLKVEVAVLRSANARKDRVIARMAQQVQEQGAPVAEVPGVNREQRRAAAKATKRPTRAKAATRKGA